MRKSIDTLANVCAGAGVVLYIVAFVGKYTGVSALVLGHHPASIVIGGIALMTMAIFGKVATR